MRNAFSIFVCICSLYAQVIAKSDSPHWHLNAEEGWKDEFLALKYFHNSELQRQWAWHLLGSHHFVGNERILDFGCGDGKITAEIAHFIPQGDIVGVDLSSSMILLAKCCFPSVHFPNVTFEQTSDVHFKNENQNKYDVICSFCVFHLVPDPIQVLKNLQKLLTPKGKLLLVIPCGNNPAFFQAANETFDKYKLPSPWSSKGGDGPTMRTKEGCVKCLTDAGFELVSLVSIHTPTAFYNKQELVEWMVGTVAPNWKIPLDKANAFFNDLIDRMAKLDTDVIDKSGAYHMKLSRFEVIAKKTNK